MSRVATRRAPGAPPGAKQFPRRSRASSSSYHRVSCCRLSFRPSSSCLSWPSWISCPSSCRPFFMSSCFMVSCFMLSSCFITPPDDCANPLTRHGEQTHTHHPANDLVHYFLLGTRLPLTHEGKGEMCMRLRSYKPGVHSSGRGQTARGRNGMVASTAARSVSRRAARGRSSTLASYRVRLPRSTRCGRSRSPCRAGRQRLRLRSSR